LDTTIQPVQIFIETMQNDEATLAADLIQDAGSQATASELDTLLSISEDIT